MRANRRLSPKLIAAAGVLSVAAALYLHFGLLPGRLTQMAIEKLESYTHKRIYFDKLLYLPFRGISFNHFRLMDESGSLIFSADKMAVDVKLLPFLREKKIVVANVYLDSPVYNASLAPKQTAPQAPLPKTELSGQIDVPVVPETSRPDLADMDGPDAFLPENVYLEQIEIVNGHVTLRAGAGTPPIEVIRSINVRMGFQKPPQLTFDGSVKLGEKPYAEIRLKGAWDLKRENYEFFLKTKCEKIPDWLLAYQKNRFLVLERGSFTQVTRLKSAQDGRALFHSKADLRDSRLTAGRTVFTGRLGVDAKGVFDLLEKKFERYEGTLTLNGVDVSNVSNNISSLENVSGNVRFAPDVLTLDAVTGSYQKLPFEARGILRSFTDLILKAEIRTESSVDKILSLLPAEQARPLKDFEIKGDCRAVTTVQGSLKAPSNLTTGHSLYLRGGSVRSRDGKFALEEIAGGLATDARGYTVRNARFKKDGRGYRLEAFFPKDNTPGHLKLNSEGLDLTAEYRLSGQSVQILAGSADYRGLSAQFKGNLPDFRKPWVDFSGDLDVDLGRAAEAWAREAPALAPLGLRGSLKGYFVLKGPWNRPSDWDFGLDGHGNPVYVKKDVRLDSFEAQVRMKNNMVNIPYLHATPYGGTAGGRVLFDLSKPEIFFDGKLYANNIELAGLARDLKIKQKDFSGKALFQSSLRGTLGRKNTFRGEGAFSITEGHLWETDLFKKMGELFIVKVEGLTLVTFHEANGTFKIYDQKIWTQDLTLFSETVDLSLKGWVGFDQTLDMTMFIQYSKNVLLGALDAGGIVPMVIQEAGSMISRYRIRGTLQKPIYEKELLPAGRAIGKKITGIFQS